jgi:IclR family transcriptional regulator, KDG regulon repressor
MREVVSRSFGTLEKAVEILSLFDPQRQEWSAQEISENLDMPLSTAYKYLQVFLKKSFLSRSEKTNKYRLGLALYRLGILASMKMSVIEISAPHLETMARSSLETALLTIIDGMEVLCVDAVESPRMVKLTIRRGVSLPLHAGAPGKAILAFQKTPFLRAMIETKGLEKLTRNTITIPARLEEELAAIRRQGFSQSDSEVDPGAGSLAAPIFDRDGKVTASVSIAGPVDRILGENRSKLIDLVMACGRKISLELGHLEPRK